MTNKFRHICDECGAELKEGEGISLLGNGERFYLCDDCYLNKNTPGEDDGCGEDDDSGDEESPFIDKEEI